MIIKLTFKHRLLIVACMSISCILIGGAMFTHHVVQETHSHLILESQLAMRALVGHVSGILGETDQAVLGLPTSESLLRMLVEPTGANITIANKDLDWSERIFDASVVYLMDKDGVTIASSNRDTAKSFVGKSYAFRPYFKRAITGNPAHYYALGVTSGTRGYYSSAPIKDEHGKSIGVVIIKRSLDQLTSYLQQYRFCFLISPQGIIFLGSQPDMLLRSLWPMDVQIEKKIKESRQFGNGPFVPVFANALVHGDIARRDQKSYLVGQQTVGTDGWSLVLLKPATLIAKNMIAGIAITFFLFAGTCIFFLILYRQRIATRIVRENEQQYHVMIDTVPSIIALVDEQGSIVSCNERIGDICGYSHLELAGQSLFSIFHPEHVFSTEVFFRSVLRGEIPGPLAAKIISKEGKLLDVIIKASKLDQTEAGVSENKVVFIIDDITLRRQAEQQMQKSEENYRIIFNSTHDAILVYNANSQIIKDMNASAQKMFGYALGELNQDRSISLSAETGTYSQGKFFDLMDQISIGKDSNTQWKSKRKNGEIFWSEIAMRKTQVADEELALISVRDIDASKRFEETIIVSERKLKSLNEELARGQSATINILEDLQGAKETLEMSRKNFLNIVESSTDAMIIVGNDNQAKFLNKAAEILLGYKKEVLLSRVLPIDFMSKKEKEFSVVRPDFQERSVYMKIIQTQWEEQETNLVVLHDITERKQAEELLLHAAKEWRATFDAIADGVALLDEKGMIVRCNAALKRTTDMPYEELIGRDCHDIIHGEADKKDCPIHRVMTSYKRETKTFKKENKWFFVSVDPLIDDGGLTGSVHIISDITEQKLTEQKLREYTEYVDNIFETAQAIIIVLDTHGTIQRINNFAEDMLGYNKGELNGKNWISELTSSEYKDEIRQVFDMCLKGSRVKGYEYPIYAKDKREVFVEWHSSELRDAENKVIGIVTMGYDITHRKDLEKMQRLTQLGKLVSHMAHEVNNPLMVISGRAQLSLMEEIQNTEIRDNLDIVMKECQRAKDIIQRLLRFSKPSKRELKKVDINNSIEEVVNLIEHQFKLSNVTIAKKYTQWLPKIVIDEKQMHEIFMNLLNNAFDAIKDSGTITIRTLREGDLLRIEFKDSGSGISKEVLDKIFDPFFTTKAKGTGLGLSICYSIIKAHNGNLRLESSSKGTTAIILLPFVKEEENA